MPQHAAEFEQLLGALPFGKIGEVRDDSRIRIFGNSGSKGLIDVDVSVAKRTWQKALSG
jgi:hypothetical protein